MNQDQHLLYSAATCTGPYCDFKTLLVWWSHILKKGFEVAVEHKTNKKGEEIPTDKKKTESRLSNTGTK